MAREFTPIFDRVLIRRTDSALQKKTEKAGLIIPDTIKEKYQSSEGVLVKCGLDCHPDVLKLIDKPVLFARYSGDDIKINGEEYLLATDKDIFGGITE
jgi:chaperonin GroES